MSPMEAPFPQDRSFLPTSPATAAGTRLTTRLFLWPGPTHRQSMQLAKQPFRSLTTTLMFPSSPLVRTVDTALSPGRTSPKSMIKATRLSTILSSSLQTIRTLQTAHRSSLRPPRNTTPTLKRSKVANRVAWGLAVLATSHLLCRLGPHKRSSSVPVPLMVGQVSWRQEPFPLRRRC